MKKQKVFPFKEQSGYILNAELDCKYELIEQEYMEMKTEIGEVFRSLDTNERKLLILYAELDSLRRVAKIYDCSEGTIRYYMKNIKQKFQHLYEDRYDLIDELADDDNNYCIHYRFVRDDR